MPIALVLWFGRVFSSHVLNYTATSHLMSSFHPHDFQTQPPFSMFSPALGRGKTTPYIPTAKAGSFTAILGNTKIIIFLRQLSDEDIPFIGISCFERFMIEKQMVVLQPIFQVDIHAGVG